MAKNIFTVGFLGAFALALAACSEDDDQNPGPSPILTVSGPDLLGLVDGRVLEYSRIDSIVTWLPSYQVHEDTGTALITVTGGGSDWIIRNDSLRVINLKLSDPFVLHNGYWRKIADSDALVYFPIPAVAMDRSAAEDAPWSGFVPAYTSDSGEARYLFCYGYFGFYFTKGYSGTEQIFVPAFGGDAFRYDIKLYLEADDTSPAATVVEHYAPGIGLVRQQLRADGFTRVLALRAYE